MGPKLGLTKNNSNRDAQIRKSGLLNYIMNFTTHKQGRERVEELKERIYKTSFRKRKHRCWNRQVDNIFVDLYRVRNENTLGEQIEWVDENEKIYNSIFPFKENASIEKRMPDLFKRRVIYKEKECNRYLIQNVGLK